MTAQIKTASGFPDWAHWCALSALLLSSCSAASPGPCTIDRPSCSTLEHRAYYDLDEGLTCASNTAPRTVLKTWRGKITFERDGILVWGSICNDNPELVRPLPSDLTLSADFSELQFRERRYVYRREPPQLCPGGIWCPAEAPAHPAKASP